MIIPPTAPRGRDVWYKVTGGLRDAHTPGPDDFCSSCGADLKIKRRLIERDELSTEDLYRLYLAEAAERAITFPDHPEDVRLMEHHGFGRDVQERLYDLLCEGLEATMIYGECGLGLTDLVGITADGTFLYAETDKAYA